MDEVETLISLVNDPDWNPDEISFEIMGNCYCCGREFGYSIFDHGIINVGCYEGKKQVSCVHYKNDCEQAIQSGNCLLQLPNSQETCQKFVGKIVAKIGECIAHFGCCLLLHNSECLRAIPEMLPNFNVLCYDMINNTTPSEWVASAIAITRISLDADKLGRDCLDMMKIVIEKGFESERG